MISKEKISKIEGSLPGQFLRVHRSFIINKNLIDSFNKEEVKIKELSIPIGRTYRKKIAAALTPATV